MGSAPATIWRWALGTDCVDIWWASLDHAASRLTTLLDAVERRRLDMLHRSEDRQRFVLGSSLLRMAVALSRDVAPEQVHLDRACDQCGEPHGKVQPGHGLQASVSHSGCLVIVAIRAGEPIGVDVEAVRDAAEKLLDVAPDILAADEYEILQQLPPGERAAGLLRFWTRKEAVLKATGDGLRLPLRDLVVSGPHRAPVVRRWAQRPSLVEQIWLRDLDLPVTFRPNHVATLAALGGRPGDVRVRQGHDLLALDRA